MLQFIIGKVIGGLLSPLMKLGDKYLDNAKDKTRLEHGTMRVMIETDVRMRQLKMQSWMGRFPLFVAELAGVAYYVAVIGDSIENFHWLNPLELPEWFKPYYNMTMISVFGINTVNRGLAVFERAMLWKRK